MINTDSLYIQNIIDHELALSTLYDAFATRFKKHASFWTQISQEERAHAEVARKLGQKISGGELQLIEKTFNLKYLHDSHHHIENIIKNIKNMNQKRAIQTALILERGMIEHEFFEIFESESNKIPGELEALRN